MSLSAYRGISYGWRVIDTEGGVWWPSEVGRTKIAAAGNEEAQRAEALRLCDEDAEAGRGTSETLHPPPDPETGDQRDSYRDEVEDRVIAVLRPLLDLAVAGEVVDVPWVEPSCTMRCSTGRGRALLATVMGPPHEGLPCPLVTFGVAPDSLASAEMWRAMVGGERDDRTPAPPWCVVRIEPGIAIYPEAAHWLGDYQRCVAWTWIDA